ncbi:MAG TPA: alpha/beta fold hydrolase [Devosiaceae bacterium]
MTRSFLIGLVALLMFMGAARAQTAFYDAAPSQLAGTPGTVIASEKMGTAPGGGVQYRVLYRSRGLKDEAIAVSGMVFVPAGAMPEGGWPVIAWAHPTSGLVSKCAPSLARNGMSQVQGLEAMLAHGYVVTATDYPGLGTPGPHPFLVGDSEGRAVLDSIRAARALVSDPGEKVFLWGHSQGGQAVLFAADMAGHYAPELHILGVAAAAPATELGVLMDADIGTSGGKNLLAMTLWAWSQVFDAPLAQVVTPAAEATINGLADQCLESIWDVMPRLMAGNALQKSFLSVDDINALEPWKDLMNENTIGALPPAIPVLLVQGETDTTVDPSVTQSYLATLCKGGSRAALMMLPGVGHLEVAAKGAPAALDWMSALLAGTPPSSDCS